MKAILILLLLSPHLVWSQMAFPYISFVGAALPNHSYVDLSQVGSAGDGSDSVQCHTDLTTCCNNTVDTDQGHWYFPNGEQLPLDHLEHNEEIIVYESPQNQRVDLRQGLRNANHTSGMYHCAIATNDENGLETVYVGLYTVGGKRVIHYNYRTTLYTLTLDYRGVCNLSWGRRGQGSPPP